MITARTNIRSALGRDGYCLVPAAEFELERRAAAAFCAFQELWAALEPDAYIKATPPRRLRRHAQFRYQPSTGQLSQLPNSPYYQSLRSNPLYGGKPREFAPFTSDAANNRFFRDLVEFNLLQFPEFHDTVDVHAHMVRIVGRIKVAGEPSPEGMHQDGFDFISIHLIGRSNVSGGETVIRGSAGDVVARVTLTSPMDSIYMDDRLLYHSTSAISPAGPGDAARDVLLLSYDQAKLGDGAPAPSDGGRVVHEKG